MKVSVNVCCYNSARYLAETLESVGNQTYANWELVIINDGSTDDTDTIVRGFIAKGWPIVYRSQQNQGLARSRNRAIEESNGELIALLDHDDVWAPEKLEKQVALFERLPSVAVVYSDANVITGDGRHLWRYSEKTTPKSGRVLKDLFLENFALCSTLVLRRSAIEGGQWFRDDLRITEEYELLMRIAGRHDFGYVAEPLASYRVHGANTSWHTGRFHQETVTVARECLAREPDLAQEVGWVAARLRTSGYPGVNATEKLLLACRYRAARAAAARRVTFVLVALRLAAVIVSTLAGPTGVRWALIVLRRLRKAAIA